MTQTKISNKQIARRGGTLTNIYNKKLLPRSPNNRNRFETNTSGSLINEGSTWRNQAAGYLELPTPTENANSHKPAVHSATTGRIQNMVGRRQSALRSGPLLKGEGEIQDEMTFEDR